MGAKHRTASSHCLDSVSDASTQQESCRIARLTLARTTSVFSLGSRCHVVGEVCSLFPNAARQRSMVASSVDPKESIEHTWLTLFSAFTAKSIRASNDGAAVSSASSTYPDPCSLNTSTLRCFKALSGRSHIRMLPGGKSELPVSVKPLPRNSTATSTPAVSRAPPGALSGSESSFTYSGESCMFFRNCIELLSSMRCEFHLRKPRPRPSWRARKDKDVHIFGCTA